MNAEWTEAWDVIFFFKQKTAYEILTCDWSSDVCSSDLWQSWIACEGEIESKAVTGNTSIRFCRDIAPVLQIWLVRTHKNIMVIVCAGCDEPIMDRFLMNVLDRAWHSSCVACADCKTPLTEKCFSRDGKLYCRNDFFRWVVLSLVRNARSQAEKMPRKNFFSLF